MFEVDGVSQQGPAVTVVVLNVMSGVEEVPQAWQVFVFAGPVGW